MPPDETLVTRCLEGDESAFRTLMERHQPRLYRLAAAILHDGDLAADAVQEAFLRAYTRLAEFRGRGAFPAWLRRIVVNQCLSELRRRHAYLSLEDLDPTLATTDTGPEAATLYGSQVEEVRRALGALPAHHRAALVLRVVEELPYREIAELLSVPESTIETWIHRGRQRLRAHLSSGMTPRPAPALAPTEPLR